MTLRPRKRHEPEDVDFQDPLENYDPPKFADDLERSLAEDAVTVIDHRPFQTIDANTSVREALRIMHERGIACLVVTNLDGKPVGILSERDVLTRIAPAFEAMAEKPVRDAMTPDPVVVYESEPPARAVNLMGSGQFRHLPVVDLDGRLIGTIGARRVISYLKAFSDGNSGE
ncbi:MAG: CBS domain-containing protein [Phycisphaera sp.]|nr:CBS domain-containing protein [Phycisphaera sp.]